MSRQLPDGESSSSNSNSRWPRLLVVDFFVSTFLISLEEDAFCFGAPKGGGATIAGVSFGADDFFFFFFLIGLGFSLVVFRSADIDWDRVSADVDWDRESLAGLEAASTAVMSFLIFFDPFFFFFFRKEELEKV